MCNFILGCVCTSALTVIIIIKWKEYLCICYLQDLGNSTSDGLAYIVLSGSITWGVLSNINLFMHGREYIRLGGAILIAR